jgi:hypothetical protein
MQSTKTLFINLVNKLVINFIKHLSIIKGEKQGGLDILEGPRGKQDENG